MTLTLGGATQTATGASAERYFGKYRGLVTNVDDPKSLGRLRARVPELLDTVETGWALPAIAYAGDGVGSWLIPPVGAGVWIEFEAGDPSRPIWTGCWWSDGQRPKNQDGSQATPALKMVRSEKGLMVSIDDDGKTVAVSDEDGSNIVLIEVSPGKVTVKASTKAIVEAPQIELVDGASHPLVYGDDLLQYLNQVVQIYGTHMHPGELALGSFPVTPAPPVPPLPPAQPSLLSMKVKTG